MTLTHASKEIMIIMTYTVGLLLLLSATEAWYSSHTASQRRNYHIMPLFLEKQSTTAYEAKNTITTMTSLSRAWRKTRIIKAPLVDSTLLRFLSTQKRHVIVHSWSSPYSSRISSSLRMEDNTSAFSSPYSLSTTSKTWNPSSNLSLSSRYLDNLITTASPYTLLNETSSINTEQTLTSVNNNNRDKSIISYDGNDLYDSKISSSDRISLQLIEMGTPDALANQASVSVQTYTSFIIARRNVLQYIKDRSSAWKTKLDPSSVLKMYWGERTQDLEPTLRLLHEAGFTGKDIASILIHTPSIAIMQTRSSELTSTKNIISLEDTIQQSYLGLLCGVLRLRKCDARKIVRSCPGLLTKKGSKAAQEVITILFSLGVSVSSLTRDKSVLISLLSRSPKMIFRLVAFLSSEIIKMPIESIGPLIRRMECGLLLDTVAPISNLPSSCGIAAQSTNKMEAFASDKLTLDSLLKHDEDKLSTKQQVEEWYHRMVSTATFLKEDIGISDLGKILSSYPTALLVDKDHQIRPLIEFLQSVGIESEEIPRVIESFPSLLASNVTNMKEAYQYLVSLEVSADVIGSIVRAFPSILTLGVEERMIPVVEFLKNIGVTNIGRFVTRLPPVLGYSVSDELRPKWEYLNQICQYASFEVIRFPAFFSYPLERVIINRYEYLRTVKRVPVHLLPVDDILRYGDSDFAKIIANDHDDGREYIKFVSERNKIRRRV